MLKELKYTFDDANEKIAKFDEANKTISKPIPLPEALATLVRKADEVSQKLSSTDDLERKIACEALQRAVAEYIDAHAVLHHIVGKALDRRVRPPIADVVTEAVNVAVRAMVNALEPQLGANTPSIEVKSEHWAKKYDEASGKPVGDPKKPDVSVWQDGKLCFVIEVKTNLGWLRPTQNNQKGWIRYFTDLQRWYKDAYALDECEVVLLVASEGNINSKDGMDRPEPPPRPAEWLAIGTRAGWPGAGTVARMEGRKPALDDLAGALRNDDFGFVGLQRLLEKALRRPMDCRWGEPEQLGNVKAEMMKILGEAPQPGMTKKAIRAELKKKKIDPGVWFDAAITALLGDGEVERVAKDSDPNKRRLYYRKAELMVPPPCD